MRGFLKVVIIVSGITFLVTLVASIVVITGAGFKSGSSSASPSTKETALFHVLAILPSSDVERFYARSKEAMERAARKNGAILQTLAYSQGDAPSAIARVLKLAAELDPDGVIVSVPDDPAIVSAVNALVDMGIPVVALEKDLPESKRSAFVGTNPFSVGKLAGETIGASFPRGANAALILSRDYAESDKGGAILVAGFLQGIRDRPGLKLVLTRSAREGPSASEDIVRDILEEHHEVDVAVFTGARDAEGAARALLEYDKVGKLAILGFDDDPALLELVDMGVVFASIARSPENSGEEAVTAVMSLARGGRVSAYINPGLKTIRRGTGLR